MKKIWLNSLTFISTFVPITTVISCDTFIQKKKTEKKTPHHDEIINFENSMIDWHLSGFQGQATINPTTNSKKFIITNISKKNNLTNGNIITAILKASDGFTFINQQKTKNISFTVKELTNQIQTIAWNNNLLTWSVSGEDGTGSVNVTKTNSHFTIGSIAGNGSFSNGDIATVELTANSGWVFPGGSTTKSVQWNIPHLARHLNIINFQDSDLNWKITGSNHSGSATVTSTNTHFTIGTISNNGNLSNNDVLSVTLTAKDGFSFSGKENSKIVHFTVSTLTSANSLDSIQSKDLATLKQIIHSKSSFNINRNNFKAKEIAAKLVNIGEIASNFGLDFSKISDKSNFKIKATGNSNGVINVELILITPGATIPESSPITFSGKSKSDNEVDSFKSGANYKIDLREQAEHSTSELAAEVRRLNWNPKHYNETASQIKKRMTTWVGIQNEFSGHFIEIFRKYPLVNFITSVRAMDDADTLKLSITLDSSNLQGITVYGASPEIFIQYKRGLKLSTTGVHFKGDTHPSGSTLVVDNSFHRIHPNWNFSFNKGLKYDFSKLQVAWASMLSKSDRFGQKELPFNNWNMRAYPTMNFSSLEIIEKNAFEHFETIPNSWTFPKLKIIKGNAFSSAESLGAVTGSSFSQVQSIGKAAFDVVKTFPDLTNFSGVKYLADSAINGLDNMGNLKFDNLVYLERGNFSRLEHMPDYYTFPKLRYIYGKTFNLTKVPVGLNFPAIEKIVGSPDDGYDSFFDANYFPFETWFTVDQINLTHLKIIGQKAFANIKVPPPIGLFPNVELIENKAFAELKKPWEEDVFPKLKHISGQISDNIGGLIDKVKKWIGYLKTEKKAFDFILSRGETTATFEEYLKLKKWIQKMDRIRL